MIQSAQVIIYGNQKHNYLNAIKAEQLRVGKELLVCTSLINTFGTSIIDQHFRESIKLDRLLSLLSSSRVTVFQLSSFQLDFKGHVVAVMEFPD